jgi:hypothetical protein
MDDLMGLLQDTLLRLEATTLAQALGSGDGAPELPWRPSRGLPPPPLPPRPVTPRRRSFNAAAASPSPSSLLPPPPPPDSPVDYAAVTIALVAAVRERARTGTAAVRAAAATLVSALRRADPVATVVGYVMGLLAPNCALLQRQVDTLLALAKAGPRYDDSALAAPHESDVVALLDQWEAMRRAADKPLALLQTYTAIVETLCGARTQGSATGGTTSLLRVLDSLAQVRVEADLDGVLGRAAVRQLWRACAGPHQPLARFDALVTELATGGVSSALPDLDLRPNGVVAQRVVCVPGLVAAFQLDEWAAAAPSWLAALQMAQLPRADADADVLRAPPRSGSSSSSSGGVSGAGGLDGRLRGQSAGGSVPALAADSPALASLASPLGTTPPNAGALTPIKTDPRRSSLAVPSPTTPASTAGGGGGGASGGALSAEQELAMSATLPLEAVVPGSLQHAGTIHALLTRINLQLWALEDALADVRARREDLARAAGVVVPPALLGPVVSVLDRDAWARMAPDDDRRQMLCGLASELCVREADLLEAQAEQDRVARYECAMLARARARGR